MVILIDTDKINKKATADYKKSKYARKMDLPKTVRPRPGRHENHHYKKIVIHWNRIDIHRIDLLKNKSLDRKLNFWSRLIPGMRTGSRGPGPPPGWPGKRIAGDHPPGRGRRESLR